MSSSRSVIAMTPLNGFRISWLMIATNSLFAASAAAARWAKEFAFFTASPSSRLAWIARFSASFRSIIARSSVIRTKPKEQQTTPNDAPMINAVLIQGGPNKELDGAAK